MLGREGGGGLLPQRVRVKGAVGCCRWHTCVVMMVEGKSFTFVTVPYTGGTGEAGGRYGC